jgi:hypothetical protein
MRACFSVGEGKLIQCGDKSSVFCSAQTTGIFSRICNRDRLKPVC